MNNEIAESHAYRYEVYHKLMAVSPFLLSVWCSFGSHTELLIIILGDVTILP